MATGHPNGTSMATDAPADLHAPNEQRLLDTRALLTSGTIAGPFYLAVGIAQALLRDGFVFARHPLSVLANGSGGWIQTANIVLAGLMVIGAALGIRRVIGAHARVMSWF